MMGMGEHFKRFKNLDGLPELIEGLLVYAPECRTSAFDLLLHPFFQEIKHPQIRLNNQILPNIFNFTKDEVNHPIYRDNLYRLVPDWFKEKQKRDEYLQTNYEDALLMLKL
jgi:glycogen synthase kinase 3 beta